MLVHVVSVPDPPSQTKYWIWDWGRRHSWTHCDPNEWRNHSLDVTSQFDDPPQVPVHLSPLPASTHYTPLSHRALVRVRGQDASTLLQGLVTADVLSGSRVSSMYSMMLNAQVSVFCFWTLTTLISLKSIVHNTSVLVLLKPSLSCFFPYLFGTKFLMTLYSTFDPTCV